MFHSTRPNAGTTINGLSRGHVHVTCSPIEAAKDTRRRKFAGMVGGVPQATAPVVTPVGSPASSGSTVSGVVGVTPIAAGRPRPITVAAAVTVEISISRIRHGVVAWAITSRHAAADPTSDVRNAKVCIGVRPYLKKDKNRLHHTRKR